MARFKDLSDELILLLMLSLDVCTLLPFALLNKRFHSICVPRLSKYQALHRKWMSITLSYKWDLRLVDLLIEILEEPECIRFVRKCDTNSGSWTPPTGPHWIQHDVPWRRKDNLERLRDSLMASPLVDNESFKMWMEALNKIDATAINTASYPPYMLIWSLLPDLHTIEIPAKAQRDITWLRQSQQGSKLKIVYFGRTTGYEVATEDDVAEILRLPSLQELNVTAIRINPSPVMSTALHLEDTHCHLERLTITSTLLTPTSLNSMLKRIHRSPPTIGLKSFTYVHPQTTTGPFCTYLESPKLIATLLEHTAHSLTELDFAIDVGPCKPDAFMMSKNRHSMIRGGNVLGRDLQSFQSLQNLTVAADMLVEGWWLKVAREIDRDGSSTSRYVDFVDPKVQQVCLGEILPLSLRVLKIRSQESFVMSQRAVLDKLLVLLEWWYYKVPLLRVLELGWWPEEEELRFLLLTLCDELEVQLVYNLDPNW